MSFAATLFLVSLLIQPVSAQVEEPTKVDVGVYVVNIGRFDVGSGSFSADFYLWFKWTGNYSDPEALNKALPERFELMNGKIDKITILVADKNLTDGYNYLLYRIQASFTDPVNLQRYPLDTHHLTIEVEDQLKTVNTLVYELDSESGVDRLVSIQGWDLGSANASTTVTNHLYNTTFGYPGQNYTETYSRFVFSLPIQRPVLSSMLKTMIPIIVILLIAIVSFLVKPENFGPRISLNVTTILTAVAYHINLTSSIPPIGFLTLADRLMLSVYAILVYALIVTIGLAAISNEKRLSLVKKLNQTGGIVAPIAAVTLVMIQFLI